MSTPLSTSPELLLIIHNISKRANVKSLLRAALAFGVKTVFVAGSPKFNFDVHNCGEDEGGGGGTDGEAKRRKDLPAPVHDAICGGTFKIVRFRKLRECVEAAVQPPYRARIIGIEIAEGSLSLDDDQNRLAEIFLGEGTRDEEGGVSNPNHLHPPRNVALMPGNEGTGLSEAQMEYCSGTKGAIVTIPQYGGGTASLNVNVAACVVMQRFVQWADGQGA